ncbi:MAG TPA: transaldolase [Steroidobacteraceae bacterium]|nr:transaldolase [Steroidobacteraceae bacterium]
MNPLQTVRDLGQSIWLDDIRRDWLEDGTLQRLIDDDGLAGVTSNPAIFAKAIGAGGVYDEVIFALAEDGLPAGKVYERIVLADVQRAADMFRPTFDRAGGNDGFVSLEVSPHLADDTEGTLAEARRLWREFDRPNAMIKVPGTRAGLPAIRMLIGEGININVTLLFGLERYGEVVDAWMSGLEGRLARGQGIEGISSVASFFLSRIDTLVDPKLDAMGSAEAKALRSRAAIASARLAYEMYQKWEASERWKKLAARGGRAQRLLWASTSTKDPKLPDTYYVEALIAPQTVNTLPRATIDAYRDHGDPAVRIGEDLEGARRTVEGLKRLGIDLRTVSEQLEREGVKKFIEPFDALHASLAKRIAEGR